MNVETETAESQLRRSEERYRSLALATSAIVWNTDPGGLCLEPHPGWEAFTGQTFAEQAGDGGTKVVHPDDRAPLAETFGLAAQGRRIFEAEYRLWHAPTRTWRYVFSRGVPLMNPNGTIREWIGTITDIHERRQSMERLRESEERFRSMADTAPVMIWTAGPDKLATWFNRPWLEFTGRALADEVGAGWTAGIHPEDLPSCLETFERCFDSRETFQLECRLRRRDGAWHWVLDSGLPRLSSNGEFLGYIGSCIDINDRKNAERLLRANEARLKLALQAGRMGTWERDIRTGQLSWSAEQFSLFGITSEGGDVPYETWRSRVHPDDIGWVEKQLDDAMRNGTEFRRAYRAILPDGSVRWLESRGQFYYEHGVPVRLSGVLIDVTEQKRAEEALHGTTQVLKNVIQACPLAVMLLDEEGKVRLWNEGAERMFGWKAEEVLGRFSPAVGEQYKDQFIQNLRYTFSGSALRAHETRRMTRSGAPIDVALWTAQTNLDGARQCLAIVADITERKRLEEQVRHSQKLESLGVLAGGIAHDFNNLLTGILGNVSLASDFLPPDHVVQPMFLSAIEGCERAGTLTTQLLAYAGKGRFVIEPVRFDELIRRMKQLIHASLPKDVSIHFDFPDDCPVIEGDASQFQQIAMNLILNAAEAMPAGSPGIVQVRIRCRDMSTEDFRRDFGEELPGGSYLALEVEDNGCGMNPETKARIFDPFFTTKFTGRGLGLAAVQGIVRGHKGTLHVDSEPGRGTCFTIVLPVDGPDRQQPEPHTEPAAHIAAHPGGTILVVDDEESVRETACRALERHGYRVIEAVNGQEAVELYARSTGVSAVLLDLTMPVMDGIAALKRLFEIDSAVRVILCSGYNESEVLERVPGLRVSAFLQKPYTSARLGMKVREALEAPDPAG